MESRTDFFISHTQADRAWSEWIAWTLEEAGYTTRVQAWDFPAGRNFVVEMHRATAGAERTLAVLSPDYLQSLFGMAEWAAAFAQDPTGEKGKLLPVRVREVSPDGLLAAIVYIDLVGLTEPAARERLLGSLVRGRAKPAVKPAFPGGPHPRFPGEPIASPHPGEAQAQLQSLPEDEILEPGPLPPGSHMPFPRNPREDDLRVYVHLIDAAVEKCHLKEWTEWASHATDLEPQWPNQVQADVSDFIVMIETALWPGRYPELEAALKTLAGVLKAALDTFLQHADLKGEKWVGGKFYKELRVYDRQLYNRRFHEWEVWQATCQALIFEATRAANWFADCVRASVNPAFFAKSGRFYIKATIWSDLPGTVWPVEYTTPQKRSLPARLRSRLARGYRLLPFRWTPSD